MEECVRVSKLSFDQRMADLKPGTLFPPAIPIGMNEISTSQKGFEEIGKLAGLYSFEPAALRSKISKDTYAKAVLYAVGDAIVGLRDSPFNGVKEDEWVEPMVALFKEKLTTRLDAARRTQIHFLPCHLFDSDQKAPSFKIGLVTFFPRDQWF